MARILSDLLTATIRRRLTLGMGAVVALFLTIAVAELTERTAALVRRQQVAQARSLAEALAKASPSALASRDVAALMEIVETVGAEPDLRHVLVADRDGRILAHNQRQRVGLYLHDFPEPGAGTAVLQRTAGLVDVASPVVVAGRAIGWVRVGLGGQALWAELEQVRRDGLLYALVAIALSSLLAAWTGGVLTRRIGEIQRVADAVEAGALGLRVELHGSDEAAQLAQRFNRMLDSVVRQQHALEASERLFRAMSDSSPLAIYMSVGPERRGVYVNPAFVQLFGYELADVPTAAEWWASAYPDPTYRSEQEARWRTHIQQAVALAGSTPPMEAKVVAKDGRVCDVLWGFVSNGIQHWAFGLDLTERNQAQAALQEHQAQLERRVAERTAELHATNLRLAATQFAMDRAGIGVLWVSVADGRVLYANDEVCRQLGWSAGELLGLRLADLDPAMTDAALAQWAERLRGQPQRFAVEARYRRKDQQRVPLEVTSYLHHDDAREFAVSFLRDIREQKRSEQRLIDMRDAAEAASRAKTMFLANMSHEIRTPLNAILGLAHLLQVSATPEQAQRLAKIRDAGRHLLEMMNDLLDLSKIEAGHLSLEQADFSLAALLTSVGDMFSDAARAKGLRFDIANTASGDGRRGDATRLRQALVNYVSNALKFTERGHVALRVFDLPAVDGAPWLRFEVEDSGIGLEPRQVGQLFRPFSQADASTTRRYGGTGLGLVLTRRLIEQMGGRVGVRSSPRQGSTFWFEVPLPPSEGVPSAAPRPRDGDPVADLRRVAAGRCVLLAEDHPVGREVASELLRAVGLQVEVVEDGQAALDRGRSRSYDLVLMDMQMPRLDGVEATRALRLLPGWRDVPILALTANAFVDDRRACQAAGMNDFIAKPVTPEVLYAALQRWLPATALEPTATPAAAALAPGSAPLDPEQQQCLARIAALPGVDLDRGVALTGGEAGKYNGILEVYLATHADDPRRIAARLAAQDRDGARQLAHALKGASATLGLTALAAAAADIEQRCRGDAAPLRADDPALDAALRALAQGLSALRAASDDAASAG